MSFKSILDIDVNSEKFTEFQKKFAQYQQSLKDNPKLWKSSEKAMSGAASQFQSIAELSAALALHIHDAAKDQDHFRKATDKTDLSMQKLARTTATVTKNILSSTMALLKWSGVATAIGGLLGAGGLFGIDRLASSVAGTRKEAAGIGVGSGQLGAFGLDFRRYLNNPTGFLSKISELKSSYKGAGTFAGMGISDYQTKNPADLAIEVLQKAQQKWRTTPASQRKEEYFRAFGFMDTMGMDEMRRLGGARDLQGQVGQYGRDVSRFSMPAGYQGVSDQLSRAGMGIEAALARALVPLQRPIMRLSGAIERTIENLSKSKAIKDWIDDFGKALMRFSDYLTSPEFSATMAEFMDGLAGIAKFMGKVISSDDSVSQRMGRAENRYGLSQGSLTKMMNEGSLIQSPQSYADRKELGAYQRRFYDNAYLVAANMRGGSSEAKIRDMVEHIVLSPERIASLQHSYTAGKWETGMTSQERSRVATLTADIRVHVQPGSDVSKNVALTVAQ